MNEYTKRAILALLDQSDEEMLPRGELIERIDRLVGDQIFSPDPISGAADVFEEYPEYAIHLYCAQKAWAELMQSFVAVSTQLLQDFSDGPGGSDTTPAWLRQQIEPISRQIEALAIEVEEFNVEAAAMEAP
jgi:hypothetical protein